MNPKKPEKLYRFCVKHRKAAKIILPLGMILLWTVPLLFLNAPVWLIVALDAFGAFISILMVDVAPSALTNLAIQPMLHQGDPQPFLQMTEELLSYPSTPAAKQIYLNNYCVALQNVGELQRAYDMLGEINIEEHAATSPVTKVVYYNNMAYFSEALNMPEQAIAYYQKAQQVNDSIKSDKLKKATEVTIRTMNAHLAFLKGEYRTCLALVQLPAPTLYVSLDQTMLHARAAIALGDVQAAKEKLNEVIAKGNKLYCVTEAKELLNTLE